MKVLVICTVDLDRNGISTCIMNYFELIASEEIQIDIVAPNLVNDEIKEAISSKVMKLYELPIRKEKTFKYFWELRSIISKGKYDIVHAHGNSCTLAIELLAAKLGGCSKRIAHSHNTTCEHMRAHKLLRPIFEVCCTERFACGEAAGKWLFRDKKFHVIKNGVNLELYQVDENKRREIRKSLNVLDTEILVGHIGMFNYQKNHDFLIEVFRELTQRENNNYKMIMIGDGPLKSEIETKVKRYNIEDKAVFTGNINNVIDYLQAIDVLLLPSRFEGLPYVLVEAQAIATLCIVSDNVSSEAKLTDLVHFVSLDSVNVWVDKIIREFKQYTENDRCHYIEKSHSDLEKKGYSLIQNAEYVKSRYLYEK